MPEAETTDPTRPDAERDASAPPAHRYTQSQFAVLFLAFIAGSMLAHNLLRYAAGVQWISKVASESAQLAVLSALIVPLIWTACLTRMSRPMRRSLTAALALAFLAALLNLTEEFPQLSNVPLLGKTPLLFGENGSLNRVLQTAGTIGWSLCAMYLWYLAMSESDAARRRLAAETRRLEREIRQRRKAEARIQELTAGIQHSSRLNVMGEMAAGVAHELHQPLAAITNFADACKLRLANGTLTPERAGKELDEIAAAAHRAGTIVGRIRSFVKKQEPSVTPTGANAVVRDALRLAQSEIAKRKIDVRLDLAGNLPPLPVDAVEVTQVALNLILNGVDAIAAADKPPRTLTIQTRRKGENGVQISVRDSGSGVLPDADAKIYNQFFTTKQHGLGMGLAICRAIVERYEGRLWHESKPGTGSVFHFTLPAVNGQSDSKRLAIEKVA